MAKKQRLNSLDRFRKQSERLILEQHSHCEVPAGCGGVVLRWRNPMALRSVVIWVYTAGPAACFLDGAGVETGHIDLAPGPHVLAVALDKVDLSAALLMAAVIPAADDVWKPSTTGPSEPPWKLVTGAGGSWKFTLQPPGEGWNTSPFDDSTWTALVKVPTPSLNPTDQGGYACRTCAEHGAKCLGLPDTLRRPLAGGVQSAAANLSPRNVWIRKVFELPAPKEVEDKR
jgi:hypothetical protein